MPPFNAPKISTRMACVSVFADSNKNLTKILKAHISNVAIKNTTTVSSGDRAHKTSIPIHLKNREQTKAKTNEVILAYANLSKSTELTYRNTPK